jgi:hypothetical protein
MSSKEHIVRGLLTATLCATVWLAQVIGFTTQTSADQRTRQIVRVGSITFYVPRDWLSFSNFDISLVGGGMVNKPSDKTYNAEAIAISGRTLSTSPYIEGLRLPKLVSILTAESAYLERQNKANAKMIAEAWARGNATSGWGSNILEIQPGLYLLVGSESPFRLEQPLIVNGLLSAMNSEIPLERNAYARYRIAPDVSIRLMFDLKDFPPDKWVEMDRDVQKLIEFLKTPD